MDLLSDAERDEITAAIKDVTDTFMKSPVRYYKLGQSLDKFNEDNSKPQISYYDYLGLVEYKAKDGDYIAQTTDGNWDYDIIKVTFNSIDVAALIDPATNGSYVVAETDYFQTKGKLYKMIDTFFDGPLTDKALLFGFVGKLVPTQPIDFTTATPGT